MLYAPSPYALDHLKGAHEALIRSLLKELAPELKGFEIRVGNRPTTAQLQTSTIKVSPVTRADPRKRANRQLSEFMLARLRQALTKVHPGATLSDCFREVVWSIEQGALAKVGDVGKAINTAVMLIREGQWTRPNRMPPNWRLCLTDSHEPCSAA